MLKTTNRKFISKGLLLLLVCLSLSIASAQHITIENGYYGLCVKDSVLLENKYDTIYNPLINEVGPVHNINRLDSNFYVFRKNEKYGYIIIYDKIESTNTAKVNTFSIDSIGISKNDYDSIYWRGSISRYSQSTNNEGERYRSILILKKENKIGFLFLQWVTRRNSIYQAMEFTGIKSSTVFKPNYDSFSFDKNLIVKSENQFGIIFSNGQIIEPQYDSIKNVALYYYPLDEYYYAWQRGKCGMIVNNKLVLPLMYDQKDLETTCEDTICTVIIKATGDPYTIFFPKDSTYLKIKTENGVVLNSDSIVTFLEIHQRTISPACVLHVTRYDTVGPKFKEFYPQQMDLAQADEVYFLDKENGNVIASYTNKASKYIIFNGMVAEITPKNNRKKKYKITVYKMLDKTILTEYTWPYYSGNTIIEIPENADGADGEMYYVFGYFNSKDVFIRIGYIHTTNLTFHKKID